MIPFLSLKDVTALHGAEINAAVSSVVNGGWYLQGEQNRCFEQEYARYIGTGHAVGCANGLDALTLIYRAYIELGVMSRGDEVIVPANTYIATLLAITENGLRPVLVEPRLQTLEIDDTLIEPLITPRTKAVCIVHLYGRNACTARLLDLCRSYGLRLIEDNAQAHGCMFRHARTGSLGHAAGHSFYPGKNLGALGDGGAVTTDDDELATAVRTLANYGSQKKYVFRYAGRNSRLDEIQAAVLRVKLRHLDRDNQHRKAIGRLYTQLISNPCVTLPDTLPDDENVFHIFPILCTRRDELQAHLTRQGIGTMIHYPIPPHHQQCYKAWADRRLPLTEQIAQQELSLPIGPTITADEAATVATAINNFIPMN
ncbi:MAG: DegT/DnrJ/EryC1/StrS family aminotransferase [Prevotella sp.]|nr:DegT/DnrJ/EryC1/StrS family aminotransferase [Prevotella sp.]